MPDKRVFLSLGSNLGDREQNLRRALELIAQSGTAIVKQSPVYETEPQMVADQPWFLNMVIECRTAFFPLQLLNVALQIERAMGRDRKKPSTAKGPRLIDIDVLLYGRTQITTPKLTVPHALMLERRFILAPLLDIAPVLRHPGSGRLLRDHLHELRGQIVRVYANDLLPPREQE
jgi:2-amino-4-hydroxy-6-hydroxymethyldihydropteridine diphosphokinase